jgi:hypothetical protein
MVWHGILTRSTHHHPWALLVTCALHQVPSENFEYMQLLRYMPCAHVGHPDCQFYLRHHDTIPELTTMQPGPRVYTFFLYLSDVDVRSDLTRLDSTRLDSTRLDATWRGTARHITFLAPLPHTLPRGLPRGTASP